MARVALLAQKCHYGLGKHKTSRDSPYEGTPPHGPRGRDSESENWDVAATGIR